MTYILKNIIILDFKFQILPKKFRKYITLNEINIIFAKMMFLFLLCVKISTQGGNNTMKIIKTIICKISPAIIACLTLALSINANTSTCFVMYQPKTPAKLDEFKKIK